jgi:thioredoxin-like negative regulator of GroEL
VSSFLKRIASMNEPPTVERRIHLSSNHVVQLQRLSQAQALSEDQIIEKALDLLFDIIEGSGNDDEPRRWELLSQAALERVWNNEADAVYDNWRDLYGSSAR